MLRRHWGLLLAFLLTAGQGLAGIYYQNLVIDEASSFFYASQVDTQGFKILIEDVHMTLYTGSIYFWSKAFGATLVSFKLFSLLISFVTIVYTYKLASAFVSKRSANYAVLLLSLSGPFVIASYQTRTYALLICLSTVSSYYLLKAMDSGQKSEWRKYLVSLCLLPYSHIIGLLLMSVQLGYAFAATKSWEKRKQLILSHFIAILAFVPIVYSIFNRLNYVTDIPVIYSWVKKPTFEALASFPRYYSGTGFLYSIAIASIAYLLILAFRKEGSKEKPLLLFLLSWLVLPVLFLFFYSYVHTPIFIARGVISGVVPFSLLIAMGLDQVPIGKGANTALVFALLAFHLSLRTAWPFSDGRYDQYRLSSGIQKLSENLKLPGDVDIYFHDEGFRYNVALYLARECFSDPSFDDCIAHRNLKPLKAGISGSRDVVVIFYKPHLQPIPQAVQDFGAKLRNRNYQEKFRYLSPGGQMGILSWHPK